MKRPSRKTLLLLVALLCGPRVRAGVRHVTVAGYIGDSMCGLHHGKSVVSPAEERECTIQCVSDGSKFILADRANRKVYQLEDQSAPRRFAGKKVRVTGEVEEDGLRVETIEPAE
jgi:hypothetical protein